MSNKKWRSKKYINDEKLWLGWGKLAFSFHFTVKMYFYTTASRQCKLHDKGTSIKQSIPSRNVCVALWQPENRKEKSWKVDLFKRSFHSYLRSENISFVWLLFLKIFVAAALNKQCWLWLWSPPLMESNALSISVHLNYFIPN